MIDFFKITLKSITLKMILKNFKLLSVPPRWIHNPQQDVSVVLNQKIMLHCEADGFPKPKIIWLRGKSG